MCPSGMCAGRILWAPGLWVQPSSPWYSGIKILDSSILGQPQLGPANIFHNSYFLPLFPAARTVSGNINCVLPQLFVSLSLPCWFNASSFLCSLPKEANSLLQLQPISLAAQSSAAQCFHKPFQHTTPSPAASPELHVAAHRKDQALPFCDIPWICHHRTQMTKLMRKVQQWLPRKIWYNAAWRAGAKLSIIHESVYKSLQPLKSIIYKTAILIKISLPMKISL